MFDEILEFNICCIPYHPSGQYLVIVHVWDGAIEVNSTRMEVPALEDVYEQAFEFVKKWSLLYWDSQALTPAERVERRSRQMSLFEDDLGT